MLWVLAAAAVAGPCAWTTEAVTTGRLPALRVAADGSQHLVVVGDDEVSHVYRAARGGPWRAEGLGKAVGADVAVDPLRVALTRCGEEGCTVEVARRDGKDWSFATVQRTASQATAPVLSRDGRHLVYAVRRDSASFDLTWAAARDAGFEATVVGQSTAARPAVAVDAEGRVHLAYRPSDLADKVIRHAQGSSEAFTTEVLNADAGMIGGLWVGDGRVFAAYSDLEGLRVASRADGVWTEAATGAPISWVRADGDGERHAMVALAMRANTVLAVVPEAGGWAVEPLGSSPDTASLAVALPPRGVCPHVAWVDAGERVMVATPE